MAGQIADNPGTTSLKFELLTSLCVRESGLSNKEARMRLLDRKVSFVTGSQHWSFWLARRAKDGTLPTHVVQAPPTSQLRLILLEVLKAVFSRSPI